MCVSCGCGNEFDNHKDSRHITSMMLCRAADAAGTDLKQVITNIGNFDYDKNKNNTIKSLNWQVLKSAEERQYTLGLAYPAMKPDVGVGKDGYKDFISQDNLEEAAWNWMANHRQINLFHESNTTGHGTVVESYIWRGPDWNITSPVDNSFYRIVYGDWLLGAIWDDYAWGLIKKGLVNGWSPEGTAIRAEASSNRIATLRR